MLVHCFFIRKSFFFHILMMQFIEGCMDNSEVALSKVSSKWL